MKYDHILATLSAAEEEKPIWKILWDTFYETYFTDNSVYENLNLGRGSLISVRYIILGLFIGLTIASFAAVFNKRVLGSFVRKLLREECLSPDTGKTLPELRCAGKLFIRYGVKRGVNLRRVVRCREEEEYIAEITKAQEEYEQKRKDDPSLPKKFKAAPFAIDPDRHHFYIPEEMKYMADIKFDAKGTTWIAAVMFVVVMFIALIAVMMVLPQLLELLNEFAGGIEQSAAPDNIV